MSSTELSKSKHDEPCASGVIHFCKEKMDIDQVAIINILHRQEQDQNENENENGNMD